MRQFRAKAGKGHLSAASRLVYRQVVANLWWSQRSLSSGGSAVEFVWEQKEPLLNVTYRNAICETSHNEGRRISENIR